MRITSAADAQHIFALERREPALWKLYLIRAVLSGPGMLIALPYLYFRYHTLRYRFDEEGIHMRVGILFRREVNLTYARIQDIHLRSGFIQRWLGLADVQIQTASGSTGAELVIEGFKEYEAIRDFLYARMRGYHSSKPTDRDETQNAGLTTEQQGAAQSQAHEIASLLRTIRDELRRTRELVEQRGTGSSSPTSARRNV
jgi:putative membrane protein